jgi:hypothetical protein
MKSTFGVALCILSAAFTAAGQDSGQASGQAAGKTFERNCSNRRDPSTATSEKHTRREWQGIVEDMASRGATATPDELREIAGGRSRRSGNVRINQLSARDFEQEMELPYADAEAIVAYRTKNGRIENFEALKRAGIDPSKLEPYKESIVY